MNIIFAGATGAVRNSRGIIVPDQETYDACKVATLLQMRTYHDHMIVTTAGVTVFEDKKQSSGVPEFLEKTATYVFGIKRKIKGESYWMAEIMARTIRDVNPKADRRLECAAEFTTSGEMKQLARLALAHGAREIVIVVKKPQAFRAKLLCKHWLKHYHVGGVNIKVVPFRATRDWFLYECGALVKDVSAMSHRRAKRALREAFHQKHPVGYTSSA